MERDTIQAPFGHSPVDDWLSGYDIVCLTWNPWNRVPSIPEHTMSRLAKRNRVLVVEPFNSLPSLVREAHRMSRRYEPSMGIRQIDDTFWIYSPPPLGLPGHSRISWVTPINNAIGAALANRVIRKLGMRNPIVWSFLYNSGGVLERINGHVKIYDCCDSEPSAAPNENRRRLVERHERDTCMAADLVFVNAENLRKELIGHNKSIHLVPAAADVHHFGKALHESTRVPDDISRIAPPVIGYLGTVDPSKIDVSLIQQIARARPTWSIVLVGWLWGGFDASCFDEFENVHMLGAKRYEEFPNYLKGIDVCFVPFEINDVTLHADSLKVYEFLAAGRPVVSAAIPAARRAEPHVQIADGAEAFVAALDIASRAPDSGIRERLAWVAAHSWEHRTADKSRHIKRFVGEIAHIEPQTVLPHNAD